MTEQQWLTSTDPQSMLLHVRDKASDRKLRLFACACWRFRTLRHESIHHESQNKIAIAGEMAADGIKLDGSWKRFEGMQLLPDSYLPLLPCAVDAAARMCVVKYRDSFDPGAIDIEMERCYQSGLLRCIFGNPFRPVELPYPMRTCFFCRGKKYIVDNGPNGYGPKSKEPCDVCSGTGQIPDKKKPCLWLTTTVTAIAQTIYDERRFDEMPILADALEEVGCTNADIINHLRGPGPHGRGCWVIDTILGKS